MATFKRTPLIRISKRINPRKRKEEPVREGSGTKLTLRQLSQNFDKIFPNSKFLALKVERPEFRGEGTLSASIRANVLSSVKTIAYSTWIVLRRKKLTDDFNIDSKAEIRCSCPAFRFFVANPDLKHKNFAGNPTRFNRQPADIRNPKGIPAPCKHLMALISLLRRRKLI